MSNSIVSSVAGLDWCDDGYSAISGLLLTKAEALDGVFRCWAYDMGATEHQFPNFIAARSLAPIGYLKSFPHLATFVSAVDRNEASFREIAEHHGFADELPVTAGTWEPFRQLLTPAACYHFYHRIAGTSLSSECTLTTKCQCHRREEEYHPLQRQWCFQMREIVCIGASNVVQRFTEKCRERVDELAMDLKLATDWEVATDPFFEPIADPKALAQLIEPTKTELVFGGNLAIGSINRHRSFFGECYDIQFNGEPAHSACVAFGIERWLYALIQVHGTDLQDWPDFGPGS